MCNITVSGCWFHYFQTVLKRVNKLVLEEDYQNRDDIKDIIRCIPGLPLLPAADIPTSLQEMRATICYDMSYRWLISYSSW